VEPLPLPYDTVTESGWRLELTETALRLSKEGEPPIEVPRAKALELLERVWLGQFKPFFVVLAPRRRVFRLNDQQAESLNRWLGDDYGPELRHQLKQRLSLAVPIGIFFVLSDPRGVVSWILGGLLVAEGLIRWLRPSHWLFLFEMAFWLGLLLRNGWRVIMALQTGNVRGLLVSGVLGALAIFFLMMSGNLFLLLRAGIEKRR
jgi:hypothetical protein